MMTEPPIDATPQSGAKMDRKRTPARKRWWGDRRLLAALAIAVAAFLGWRLLPASGSVNVSASDIETGQVSRGVFHDYAPLRATVAPALTTLVAATSGGQIKTLLVQDGSVVHANQPLAMLANPELRLQVLTQEAQIAGQLGDVSGQDLTIERNRRDEASDLASAKYDLIKARRDLAVREQLHAQGFVSDAGVRSFAEEVAYQQGRVAQLQSGQSADAGIRETQQERLADTRSRLSDTLAAVRDNLDALVIRAPAAGRLTNFTIQPGQTLKAGDSAGQIDSEGAWKLIADVDEYYLGRVSTGQKAQTGDGAALTVSRVLPAVTDGHFRVELTFDQAPPAGLNRGQTLDVSLTLGAAQPALVAPVGGWLDAGGGTSVFVLDADGRHAHRRAIRVDRRNPEQVEIVSGLRPGDRIVTSATSATGDAINIR